MTSGLLGCQLFSSSPSRWESVLLAGLLMVGCSASNTPVGPLGTPLEFSEYVQNRDALTLDKTQHQATFPLGESGVEMCLVWTSLQQQNHTYLASAEVEVAKAAPGVSIERGGSSNPINIGTAQSAIEQRSLLFTWHRQSFLQTQSGTVKVSFAANGTWRVD
ncbi:hypothetical protein [Acaryochloris sp. IP29b_bin.148]|uniref:hypothetical protein n=1 Tax=Acaryochloris sp. IP29b_bin.148 TaxID=2969218 RepID=UPI002622C8CF|nr:hypothetical protein [Acaryochloris sp. IP29b_bin.148]